MAPGHDGPGNTTPTRSNITRLALYEYLHRNAALEKENPPA